MRGLLGTVLGVYVAINAYLFVRLFQSLAKTGLLQGVACTALLIFAISFPAGRILADRLPDVIAHALRVMGNLIFHPCCTAFFSPLRSIFSEYSTARSP